MGSNVLDQSSFVLLAMEDQGSCITLGLRIRDPVSVSYVLRNLVKVWCLLRTSGQVANTRTADYWWINQLRLD